MLDPNGSAHSRRSPHSFTGNKRRSAADGRATIARSSTPRRAAALREIVAESGLAYEVVDGRGDAAADVVDEACAALRPQQGKLPSLKPAVPVEKPERVEGLAVGGLRTVPVRR